MIIGKRHGITYVVLTMLVILYHTANTKPNETNSSSAAPCGQVVVLPSRRLVRPAADVDFVKFL